MWVHSHLSIGITIRGELVCGFRVRIRGLGHQCARQDRPCAPVAPRTPRQPFPRKGFRHFGRVGGLEGVGLRSGVWGLGLRV